MQLASEACLRDGGGCRCRAILRWTAGARLEPVPEAEEWRMRYALSEEEVLTQAHAAPGLLPGRESLQQGLWCTHTHRYRVGPRGETGELFILQASPGDGALFKETGIRSEALASGAPSITCDEQRSRDRRGGEQRSGQGDSRSFPGRSFPRW